MSDSNLHDENPLLLYERFLSGTISPEEAETLDRLARENAEIGNRLCQSVLIDFLLKEDADFERHVNLAGEGQKLRQDILPDWEPTCGLDLFPGESCETTIAVPSFMPEEKPGVWHRFLSFRQERSKTKVKNRSEHPKEDTLQRSSRIPLVAALCGLAFLLGIFLIDLVRNHRNGHDTDSMIARITDTVDARWGKETFAFRRGQSLGPDKLSLESGMVKLEFGNGTELVLKGPGEYTLNSSVNVFCHKGNLSAFVADKTIAFGVTTPSMSIIDRGTAFYVDVEGDQSQVGVMSGHVDLVTRITDHTAPQVVPLSEGKAMRGDMNNAPRAISLEPDRFVSAEKFTKSVLNYALRETQKSEEANRKLDTDPDLLVRFDFTRGEKSVVANNSFAGKEICRAGNIRGCRLGEGRFAGTQALVFGEKNSRVDFSLPGEYEALTLFVKVRIRSLSNWGSILFAAGDSMEKEGSFL